MAENRTGKVFISHSSDDKEFVRKLAKELDSTGFSPWLDERELLVGDQLAKEIAGALDAAGALIVVVSESSASSDWVSYELNLVAEKVVRGDLRIIPALIGDSTQMPKELRGRMYADFRTSFKDGFALIVRALDQEEGVIRSGRRAAVHEIESLLGEIFGSRGWSSSIGTFRSIDYDMVQLPPTPDEPDGREISYEIVLGSDRELPRHEFDEYAQEIQRYGCPRALLISERPLPFLGDADFESDGRLGVIRVTDSGWSHMTDIVVVVVDFSGNLDHEGKRASLQRARGMFEAHLPSGPSFISKL